ncbi:serine/threonine-protein kinase Nek9 [Nymphalis io]|uniref:serine/threonine-protein kinase Nek9 n=1 Tax=Inachis io TaxID=171585 RepID=UPI002169C762|nr:serine/threonine-protein kinase Nek9 [Nymphalis io]
MYIVTGSNLFGQWFSWTKNISFYDKFEEIYPERESKIDLKNSKLITSCWSYNIFDVDNIFYIVGSWHGRDNQIVKVPIPEEKEQSSKASGLLITGNDYMIILVEAITRSIWFFDFETEDFKKVKFNEEPILENTVKKSRLTDDVIKVAATNNTFIYLTSEGNVYTGQLPSYIDTHTCVGKTCDVECGYEHYMLLTTEGRVYTWGNGRRLQLGHGDLTNLDLPTEVEALAGIKIVKIKAGGWHSLALSEHGDLYAWGWNDTGQLGMNININGEENLERKGQKNYAIPRPVDIYDDQGDEIELIIKDIACGTRHSAILLEDNTVWTTGCNKYGQLGFSPKDYEKLEYFKKSYQNPNISNVIGGPWSTIVEIT